MTVLNMPCLVHVVPEHLLGVEPHFSQLLVVDLAQLLVVNHSARFVLQ